MLEYIFITFVVIFCIQVFYYIFIFGFFSFTNRTETKKVFTQPVSVLICAKNEAKNLKQNLPFYLYQEYSNYELVLINDCSYDTTLEVLKQFKKTSTIPVKIVNVAVNEQFWGNKKYALTLGIKAASHEHLLFTDADCKPSSNSWISEMVSNFSTSNQVILGYGSYKKIKNSFLNKLIRFETLLTAIQYFSYAKIGIPYMGVGRNLSYTKSLFFSVNGFANHLKIKSGDDDLFINQVATSKNTTYCYSRNSFTISSPKPSFKTWIKQKRRHISTAHYYKPLHKFLLGLFYSSQLLFWVVGLLLLVMLFKWKLVLIMVIARFIIQYFSIGFSAQKLNENDLIVFIPFFELFLIFTQMFIFIKNLVSKPTHW